MVEILFGIQASQHVNLSNIMRSLEEDTPLTKTEDRLSRHLLVVAAGFGKEPLLLLTNLLGARDSQSLWWIVQIYLTRGKIEETFH